MLMGELGSLVALVDIKEEKRKVIGSNDLVRLLQITILLSCRLVCVCVYTDYPVR